MGTDQYADLIEIFLSSKVVVTTKKLPGDVCGDRAVDQQDFAVRMALCILRYSMGEQTSLPRTSFMAAEEYGSHTCKPNRFLDNSLPARQFVLSGVHCSRQALVM